MILETFFGKAWDKTHILSDNVSLLVYDIPEIIVGKTGYFLIKNDRNIRFLLKYIEFDLLQKTQ